MVHLSLIEEIKNNEAIPREIKEIIRNEIKDNSK